jgi:ribose 5-phosphate isomerase A
MTNLDDLKKAAAEKAIETIQSGMVLGLGTGSTVKYTIIRLGELLRAGVLSDIVGVPTSESTVALARQVQIPLATLDEQPVIDLAIDGADEVAPNLDLIKGMGGALLREKMIELAATMFVVVVDGSKLVGRLGAHSPLPIEVVQYGWRTQARWLEHLGCMPELRGGEEQPYVTDNGNYILHCTFPNGIDDPQALAATLHARTGIVGHGLFLGMANEVIVADAGGIRSITSK